MPELQHQRQLLIISRNFPPIVGGIERLMHRLGTGLCGQYRCVFIVPRGSRLHLPATAKVFELPHRPAVLFVLLATILATGLLFSRRFIAVIAGNGLMATTVAIMARVRRVPLITMVYGLDIVTTNPLYRSICLPMIRSSQAVIACSGNTGRLAVGQEIDAEKITIITPAVDMPTEQQDSPCCLGINNPEPVILSVGRLVQRKGIADFIRHSFPLIVSRFPNVQFVVIGSAPDKALRREPSEFDRIKTAIAETGLCSHVKLLGHVPDRELVTWMSTARVHIFPVKDLPEDVEGFGLVALEAASHGVPTVAFDAGGVSDAVEPDISGVLVPPGDFRSFANEVCVILEQTSPLSREKCLEFARQRNWNDYTKSVARVIERVAMGA